MPELTDKILSLRQGIKANQKVVADAMGISVPAYSKIEKGITDVNISRLQQLADFYNIPISNFFNSELLDQLDQKDKQIQDLKDKLIDVLLKN